MSFTFVIPIVHPEGARIKDYARVENILRVSLDSLIKQTSDAVSVVVVCHQLPEWHDEYAGRVHFLLVEPNPQLPHHNVHIDKGIKLIPGVAFALYRLGAEHIMLIDGDDYSNIDLARRIQSGDFPASGKDGWIITGGYHAQVRPNGDSLAFEAAYEVSHFDRNCGSCRIFHGKVLPQHMERVAPTFHGLRHLLPSSAPASLPKALVDAVIKDAPNTQSLVDPFVLFANHIYQDKMFDFARVKNPLMAKGCGHGNHDAKGDIYWYRVKRQINVEQFMADFGLTNSKLSKADPLPESWFDTKFHAWSALLREIPKSLLRKTKAYLSR